MVIYHALNPEFIGFLGKIKQTSTLETVVARCMLKRIPKQYQSVDHDLNSNRDVMDQYCLNTCTMYSTKK
jgi:hypothetical protein